MRMISRERATGKLIESQQSGGAIPPRTLIRNAVAAGFVETDIEEVEVTETEWAAVKQQWIDDPAAAERSSVAYVEATFDAAKWIKATNLYWQDVIARLVAGLNQVRTNPVTPFAAVAAPTIAEVKAGVVAKYQALG